MISRVNLKLFILLVELFLLTGVLTVKIAKDYALEYYFKGAHNKNYLFAGIEGFESLVGDYFWNKADDYFHGGVSHRTREHHKMYRNEAVHQETEDVSKKQSHLDFIQRINAAVMVNKHIHLSGVEAKEILPWFRLAALLNPHNVNAYVIGAFWLARKFGKPEKAMEFLKEGRENNPDDYRIYWEFAFLYYYRRDFEKAIESLETSKSFWKSRISPNDDEMASLYDFLGFLYWKTGEYSKSLENYEKFLKIFPADQEIKDRIVVIQSLQNKFLKSDRKYK